MEMTLKRLGLGSVGSIISSVTMPAGILVLVAMMVLPLPAFLLDTFFVTNILVSLLVLMVALQTNRPLDFSSFPTLLLIATVLRLGLNVASTRIILGSGHEGPDAAGKVIEAFGAFVIAGNFAVGIFVFIILVIINLVVITKGAGRVSEVSARFTLDAMPGKQMAIDADLNAGVLTNEEARARREEITSEADFYGAMDGASKFVKGDAIAGILILAINIVGGLIIGLGQHDLTLETAAESYIMLSIGDGLVAQIPSLLLAIATAIIVTRVSTTQDMGTHIGHQVGLSAPGFRYQACFFSSALFLACQTFYSLSLRQLPALLPISLETVHRQMPCHQQPASYQAQTALPLIAKKTRNLTGSNLQILRIIRLFLFNLAMA